MRAIVSVAVLLMALTASAADLPEMSYINENSLLQVFPLDKATKEEVYDTYGPPTKRVPGLPFDGEAWGYSRGADSKEFTFVFRGNVVHDVIVRYPGAGAFASERSARKMQGAK